MKKNTNDDDYNLLKQVVQIIALLIISIPMVVYYLTTHMTWGGGVSVENDWIGFFGSFIPAMFGAMITLLVLVITTKQTRDIEQNNVRAQEKRDRLSQGPLLIIETAKEQAMEENNDKKNEYIKQVNCVGSGALRFIDTPNGEQKVKINTVKNIGNGHAKNVYIELRKDESNEVMNILPSIIREPRVKDLCLSGEDVNYQEMCIGPNEEFDLIYINYEDITGNKYRTVYHVKKRLGKEGMQREYQLEYKNMKFKMEEPT